MKKAIRLLFLLLILAWPASALAQSQPPITVKEVDGSPKLVQPTEIVFPNGSLTVSGRRVAFSGGGGLTIGTTAITGGTTGRVLIDVGGVVSEDAGLSKSGTGATLDITVGRDVIATRQVTGQFFTITPLSDLPSGTLRRFGSSQTNPILQWQTEANALLGGVAPDGSVFAPKFGVDATHLNTVPSVNGDVFGLLDATQAFTHKTLTDSTNHISGTVVDSGTVADGRIAAALTGKTYNGLTVTANGTNTLNIAVGKALTISDNITLASDGTGTRTLNVGAGGTLGSNAFTSTGYMPLAGGTFTGDVTHSGAAIIISGNISTAAWTTNGVRIKGTPGTLTDTTSSGTVATAYTDVLGGNTIAASSATTFTNYFTQYNKDPIAGTNVTLTNKWALGGDSLKIGTSNPLTVSNAGVLNATSPVFVTPTLGAATATSINGNTFTTGTYTLTGTAGKTLNFLKSLTLDGTDGTTQTLPSTSATIARTDAGQTFTGTQVIGGMSFAATNSITGGAGNMTITAGTGNSRTLALQSTTSGGVATTFMTGNADQSVNFSWRVIGSTLQSNTPASNSVFQDGNGYWQIRTPTTTTPGMAFDTWSGSALVQALKLGADQNGTFTNTIILSGIASDATHTDSTVCQDTTTHTLYSGSGTLGVCLGTSSARFKNSIHNLNEGLNQILALRPVNYFYDRTHGDGGRRLQYGFTAEETQKVIPVLVALDSEGKPNSVDMLGMFPIMVKAMQEMHAEIESLKADIHAPDVKHTSRAHGRKMPSHNTAVRLNRR